MKVTIAWDSSLVTLGNKASPKHEPKPMLSKIYNAILFRLLWFEYSGIALQIVCNFFRVNINGSLNFW